MPIVGIAPIYSDCSHPPGRDEPAAVPQRDPENPPVARGSPGRYSLVFNDLRVSERAIRGRRVGVKLLNWRVTECPTGNVVLRR